MSDNPYSPPQQVDNELHGGDPIGLAKRRLARPATALIIMASIESVMVAIQLVSRLIFLWTTPLDSIAWTKLTFETILFVAMITIAVGAAKMGFLESLVMARVAGILACIPIITPFLWLGIPFGIWSLWLLGRPEIQAAFSLRQSDAMDRLRS